MRDAPKVLAAEPLGSELRRALLKPSTHARGAEPGWLRRNAPVLLVYGLLLAAWGIAGSLSSVPAFILPSPLAILHRVARDPGTLVFHSLVTLQEVVLGFLLAVLLGIPLGVLIVWSRLLERLFYPLLVALQAIPKVALAPILVIWFGFGPTSKITLAFVTALFPIVINTVVGMAQTPPEMIHLMRSLGASGLQIFTKVRLIAAAPQVFGGLKIGITLAMVGAVVGEFIAANKGLGYFLLIANNAFDAPLLFGIVILLSLLSIALFYAIELIETLVLPRPLRRSAWKVRPGAGT
jgi:NitT/TauT family transport system permease protein